jgi:acyl-CoA thioesterase FadM
MYPYLRFVKVLLAAQTGSRLGLDSESVLRLRIWLGDIDFYPEVNNGRHLTLMDLGRVDLAARSSLLRAVHRAGWGLVVGGASIRYRRKVPPFSKVLLRTKIVGHDGRWFYFHQKIERDGTVCSAALVRAGIKGKTGLVPVPAVLEAAHQASWAPDLPDWVRAWVEAESLRPWPGRNEAEPGETVKPASPG